MRLIDMTALVAILTVATAAADGLPTEPRFEKFKAGQALTISVPLDSTAITRGGYPIDSAGYADLPVIGRLYVHNHTQEEVEAYLSGRLADYLKDTHIKASPAWRVTFLGHFTRQGQYYVPPNTTVWEAAFMAGGIAGERTLDDITVWRGGQKVGIPFLDMYSQGRTLLNAGFQSGDIVVVPVPRDNAGGWYWTKEIIGVTASLASILTGIVSLYITYLVYENQNNN